MQYDSSLTTCSHAFWSAFPPSGYSCGQFFVLTFFRNGRCKVASALQQCQMGRRRRIHHVLTGSILGVWTQLEGVFNRHPSHNTRMQISRVHTPTKRLVGELALLDPGGNFECCLVLHCIHGSFCDVGILIPSACVTDLTDTLKRIAVQAAGTAAVEDTTATTTTTTTTTTSSSSSSSPTVITIPD